MFQFLTTFLVLLYNFATCYSSISTTHTFVQPHMRLGSRDAIHHSRSTRACRPVGWVGYVPPRSRDYDLDDVMTTSGVTAHTDDVVGER